MLTEQTLDKLNAMKLGAMADAFQNQLQTNEAATLSFEERFGLLADAEWTAREQRKLQRRLHTAKLRYPATLEAVDSTAGGHDGRGAARDVLKLRKLRRSSRPRRTDLRRCSSRDSRL